MRKPDFDQVLKALRREKPDRPVLYELFLNGPFYEKLAGRKDSPDPIEHHLFVLEAMRNAGYDYAPWDSWANCFSFPQKERERSATISQNGNGMISDWESFEKYQWPDMDSCDFDVFDKMNQVMPEGMKMVPLGPGGVLENVTGILGYDNLCFMLYEEPELVQAVFDNVGIRLLKYYEACAQADCVGMLCSNDDWGFNTQTFLSPADMRKFVFPWHKKIVEAAHRNGKPAILHSCGYFGDIIEDVIEDMKFDGRHSYEDGIMPVEEAYETYGSRIAILGGVDMNLVTAGTPEEIYKRARAMLERTADRGGYLLGSGNSIPDYVPFVNFQALTRAALEFKD